jgi:hypothetical protein
VIVAGHTFTRTVDQGDYHEVHSTVVIYDAAVPPATRFVGGPAPDGKAVHTYAPLAQVIAHEFGHVVAARSSLERQFYEWVDEQNLQPFTRYAASAPTTEFFPEAFALFLLDPRWLQRDYPALYNAARAYASRPPLH